MKFRLSQNMAVRVATVIMYVATYLAQNYTPARAGQPVQSQRVPLFDNLGTIHHRITTKDEGAQAYFDQGLRLIYAFNHEEAIRSFEEALKVDPEAAMAYWGIAYALGPNINAPMDREQERRAYEAIQTAQMKTTHLSARERAYIDALSFRYSIAPDADRHALDRAYADKMRPLYRDDPTDVDGATMFAEALMNLRPWDYWTHDGQPNPGTMEIVQVLEEILQGSLDHIGACHYYIHTVEAWQPTRALPCAERLPSLAPGAGHLVHMPSHIYIRVGRYDKAVERIIHAVSADQHYLAGHHPSGMYPTAYYPHNIHFLWIALIMQGRSAEALKVSEDLIHTVSLDTIRQAPELEFVTSTPLLTLVRFGQWDEVLREPAPPADLKYAVAMWQYARGLALMTKARLGEAREAYGKFEEVLQAMPAERMVGLNRAKAVLAIGSRVLSGQIAAKSEQPEEAIKALGEAVRLHDGLRYNEPPDWYYPVRETLGRMLLSAGRAAEAERVFREDLAHTPENPWSLHGLAESLRAQKQEREAATVEEQFRKAWSVSDVEFAPVRFEPFLSMGDTPAGATNDHPR